MIASDFAEKAPVMAERLALALQSSVTQGVQASYATAAGQFKEWCAVRGKHTIFPVDRYWLAGWILYKAMFISVDSLKMYLAGVRFFQELQTGIPWTLTGDPIIRRTMRYVKKRYGSSGPTPKVPITLSLLRSFARSLPGWPAQDTMAFNDIVYLAAAVIATLGFLRGGEFLTSPRSDRPVLLARQVVDGCDDCITVHISHPKATWWKEVEEVRCFSPDDMGFLAPQKLLRVMRRRAPFVQTGATPAFRLADGSTLSKAFMLNKTNSLLEACGVEFTDCRGQLVKARSSSFRSGGVESARAAKISDPVIMALGRWSSSAWMAYSVASLSDMRSAARLMWSTAAAEGESDARRVGSYAPNGLFVSDSTLLRSIQRGSGNGFPVSSDPAPDPQLTRMVTFPETVRVGATLDTHWGEAKVVAVHQDGTGDLECTWAGFEGSYRLTGYRS